MFRQDLKALHKYRRSESPRRGARRREWNGHRLPAEWPVPIGQEGRTGARMRDLRRNSGRGEFENSHGNVFLGVSRECRDLTRA